MSKDKLNCIETNLMKDHKKNEDLNKENNDDDDDDDDATATDPVNAYFKQRFNKSRKSDVLNEQESCYDSSLGVLDIDNMSLLDEMDKYNSSIHKLPNHLNYLETEQLMKKSKDSISRKSNVSSYEGFNTLNDPSESELKIRRQRDLAKKNLMQLNNRLENYIKNFKTVYNNTGELSKSETYSKNPSSDLPLKANIPKWFEKNQSPQTPRYFVDELHSLCNTSESTSSVVGLKDSTIMAKTPANYDSNSELLKDGGIITPPEDVQLFSSSEFSFETQDPDQILARLEEDQKNFLKDQSAISNNSKISNFSGITEDKCQQWQSSSVAKSLGNDRVSIGKYFQLRSHSVNSLIGAKGSLEPEVSENCINPSFRVPDETLENGKNNSIKLSEEPHMLKNQLKRWHSSVELKESEDLSSSSAIKHSTESFESTSTLLIQDLLRGMDSGLSGTQISDRLLEYLGKTASETNNVIKSDNMETPKSTRAGLRTGHLRNSVKGKTDEASQLLISDPPTNQSKSSLVGKKSLPRNCTQFSKTEFAGKTTDLVQSRSNFDENMQSLKHIKVKKGKPFDSSTPKLETLKSGAEKLKSSCSKLLLCDEDWGLPRVSSIQKSKIINESMSGEDCEKTVVLNATMITSNKEKNEVDTDSRSIEDTIAAGDLTFVSERMKEMKKESTIISNPFGEKDILLVVQELANYPKGSIDCSGLTPILRDQFPEVLSNFSLRIDQTKSHEDSYELGLQVQETIPTLADNWLKFSSKWECKDLFIPVDVTKVLSVQTKNETDDWIILSLESLFIQCPSDIPKREKNLTASKVKNIFHVGDFLSVSMKDTLISPGAVFPCKIHVTPKVPVILPIRLKFEIKKLISKENRTQDFSVIIKCIFPRNNVTVTPSDNINFGVIPEECSNDRIISVTFDGVCDLPLKVFIDECNNFTLSPKVILNGERVERTAWKENIFYYNLKEGIRTVLQFRLIFRPQAVFHNNENRQTAMKATLSIGMETPSDKCILRKVQLEGSVAFTKFLCISSTPMIFRVTGKGKSVKKSFPLKNVGAVELKFTLNVFCENSEEQTDGLFIVPKTFIVPKDEERYFDIIFNGETDESYVRRNLLLQMEPNGICYEVELTGVVMPVLGGRSISRCSSHSGPSHSVYNPENFVFNIKSTSQSINWPAVPLDVEMKQTFCIMNSSNCNAMARFSFRKETSVFRFLNDNGESIEKLKKLLKPNCSNAMTVIFRPNSIGSHINSILIETNNVSGRKMISLNGYGGSPKIFIRNLKSDLNGSKIIRLINSEPENQIFQATLEFINKGNISGFVSIKTIFSVLSLSELLEIKPSNFVVLANSKIEVKISQKLRNDDFKQLLSGKDICKLATVTVTTGDEPSRLRLKKLVKEGKVKASESISFLLKSFIDENDLDLDKFNDDERFESVFRKNLETVEIAAIVERPNNECESTIVEVAEETVKEFVTILPAADNSTLCMRESENGEPLLLRKFNLDMSSVSSNSRDKNVTNWLESLTKP